MVGPRLFAGVDWSEKHHDLAVVDAAGLLVTQVRVTADRDGLREMIATLAGVAGPRGRRRVPVGIEKPTGLLVAALQSAGQPVVPLNPVVVARHRSRNSPTRRKSDRHDAALIANILRTDGQYHRPMHRNSPDALALRELTRAHLDAVSSVKHFNNQLRSLLIDYFPAAVTAWQHRAGGLTRPDARAVLTAAPTPTRAARLTQRQLRTILQAAGRTRLVSDDARRLAELFRAPALRQPRLVETAMGQRALAITTLMAAGCDQVANLAGQVTAAFTAHPRHATYTSFPGLGPVIGARLLGEIGDDITRFPDARSLRADCGAAPVTWASGNSHVVRHRRINNPILASTGHLWAYCTLTSSAGARAHYDRRRARGERHNAALRNLHGRLLSQLHHCLTHDLHYDETQAWPLRDLDNIEPAAPVTASGLVALHRHQ